jgi:iron complex outermembrane receptor protein
MPFPRLAPIVVACVALSSPIVAQEPAPRDPPFKQLSLEELLDVDVSLPLRRVEPLFAAPAAVSVLTSEDLRRLGAVTLPEALTAVPGMFVARFSASSWIITSRGFASTAANKLLVMIDGRTVYSPLFSGVFWDQQDAFLPDLDRIEVTRGPGASLWGSNAVNGVINVVSKPASQTQGTLITLGGGAEERVHTGVRYGGRAGAGHFRVYGLSFVRDDARLVTGEAARDGQRFGQGGFRADFGDRAQALTIQGDAYVSRADLFDRADIEASGANVLARWTRRSGTDAELNVQAYLDRAVRSVPLQFTEHRHTLDVDVDHRRDFGRWHTLNIGAGIRRSADDTVPTPILLFVPADRATNLVTAFAQDEIRWSPSFSTILGIRLERNDYTGLELQPMGRIRWLPSRTQTLWGAVSRAVRLPTRFDTDLRVLQNDTVLIAGNEDFDAETVVSYEAGYRHAPVRQVVWSAELFHNRYDRLRTQEPTGTPPIRLGNGLNANVSGVKLTGAVQPRPWFRVTTSYTYLHEDLSLDPDSRDLGRGLLETIDPTHQLQLSARFDLPHRVELDATTRYLSALPTPGTPAYTEAGFRLGWHATSRLELALIGRDLLHADHLEFVSPTSVRRTLLQRAFFGRATVSF